MITPLEIQKKEFKKALRGYSPKSVDSFLDELLEDYETMYKENIELKDKVNMLADQIRQYSTLEETLKNTLIVAQTTADEVTSSARHKAENIIEDAELRGQKLIDGAKDEVKNIKTEYDNLKKEIFIFKTRYQSFIEAQLLSLQEFYEQIENNNEKNVKETIPINDSEGLGA
ncbi:MAG: DivIVA domain-containing protein [Tissierellaceae bacterium]|nr:DivIVA domain-containing protein [Tissierellaceae bacterium]